MSSETLVTFLLELGHRAPYVELYGSWDNFSSAYPMRKDDQKGSGHWLGCHLFKNIICDGDPRAPVAGREGCLREGGTYWYYYKREDDIEFHNPAEPFTTTCPLLPGQTVNVLEMPCETVSSSTAASDGKLQRSFTLNPADRRRNPKPPPRKAKSLNANKRPKPADNPLQRLSRQKWFDDSTGRLQTAAAHDILKSFFATGDDTMDSKMWPRKLKSSSDVGSVSAFDREGFEIAKTADLDKRPFTRHGLSKGQVTSWDVSRYATLPDAQLLPDLKSNTSKDQTLPKRPLSSNGPQSATKTDTYRRRVVSAPATPRHGQSMKCDSFLLVEGAPRTSDATERPQTSWSFEPSPRESWQKKFEQQTTEPSHHVDTNFDFQLDLPPASPVHRGWTGVLDPVSNDPLSYSRSETSASSVGVGIWDNDVSSKQTSLGDYYDISHESPATTYRNSLEHSNKIKDLAASLSSSMDDSLLLNPIGSLSRNSWDPKLASQETIRPANDAVEYGEPIVPPVPTRAPPLPPPPPPPPARAPPPIPEMPIRAPPPPPSQIALSDALDDFDFPFSINVTNTHAKEEVPRLPATSEIPPKPKRAPPPPPLFLTPRRYQDETGYNPDSPYNLSPALSIIDRPQLDFDISQELRAAVAGLATAGGIGASVTEPKSPHDAILSDLGYLAGAIV